MKHDDVGSVVAASERAPHPCRAGWDLRERLLTADDGAAARARSAVSSVEPVVQHHQFVDQTAEHRGMSTMTAPMVAASLEAGSTTATVRPFLAACSSAIMPAPARCAPAAARPDRGHHLQHPAVGPTSCTRNIRAPSAAASAVAARVPSSRWPFHTESLPDEVLAAQRHQDRPTGHHQILHDAAASVRAVAFPKS